MFDFRKVDGKVPTKLGPCAKIPFRWLLFTFDLSNLQTHRYLAWNVSPISEVDVGEIAAIGIQLRSNEIYN